jgi:hypothetical protein
MDRTTRIRGGSTLWSDGLPAGTIMNNDFFGTQGNSFWVKISGVWKQCIGYIKISGVWKAFSPKVKVSGVWK